MRDTRQCKVASARRTRFAILTQAQASVATPARQRGRVATGPCSTDGTIATTVPLTRAGFITKDVDSKLNYYWKNIVRNTTRFPKFPLLGNILGSVRTTFDNYQPEMPAGREKMIHSIGSVCKFDLRIPSNSPYTGLFAPGLKRGFVRMGGAMDPGDNGITPGLGIKFPRSGVPDGDIVTLFSLDIGDQWNFFGKNQSNHLMPTNAFPQSILRAKFQEATDCVFQIGLSDMASYAQDGTEFSSPKFPFKIFMVANPALKTGAGAKTIDVIQAELDAIPAGTTLYEVYACGKPAGDEMNPTSNLSACWAPFKLGDLVTSSQCTTSW